jgi:hypothetical protein
MITWPQQPRFAALWPIMVSILPVPSRSILMASFSEVLTGWLVLLLLVLRLCL